MELWIRSQDKEYLIPLKKPICVYDNKIIYKESASYITTMAEYKTKERALEVLDEIQERIKHINKFSLVNEDYECDDCVYEMPEK